jgi:rare lipoprotein A
MYKEYHHMRHVLIAALSLLTFGALGSQSASAAWQDEIFGTGTNRPRADRTGSAAPAQGRTRSARSTPSETPAARPQRQARASSGADTGGSSAGGGLASYYWQPQRVASGGWFNPNAMTAAHKTLPFGTRVRVTNERNGQSVDVTINDRGPYIAGRVIDLSSAAAGAINMKGAGVVPVRMTVLGR